MESEWIKALLKEITLQKDFFSQSGAVPVETVYFGGGTPSLIEKEHLTDIFETLRRHFSISETAEITLEANPDDIHPEKLETWKLAGINRLSIGIQSFYEEDLHWMNRAHNAEQAARSILLAQEAGFSNLSADLIFGGPTLSDDHWQQNVSRMIQSGIPHLSCYALTVEPQTALDNFIRQKKYPPVDAEQAARHFLLLMEWLEKAGYEQYEISNFSKPGKQSRHNSSYWRGIPYLGLGPSAHSYNGKIRQWNISNNALYIQSIQRNIIPFEQEILTPEMRLNEYIMTSLRTSAGCDLTFVAAHFGAAESERVRAGSLAFREAGKMILEKDHLCLTQAGKLFADGISADLFV